MLYTGSAKRITLIDRNGKILLGSTSKIIDVNRYPKGIYFLKSIGPKSKHSNKNQNLTIENQSGLTNGSQHDLEPKTGRQYYLPVVMLIRDQSRMMCVKVAE